MDSKGKIAAIILSAGYSSRMKDFKPLLKIGNRTALEHIVESFYKAKVEDIIVVIGHNAEKIKDTYKGLKVKFVYNRHYSKGMYSSVVEGVKYLDKEIYSFFVLPVDIPIIKYSTINEIKGAFEQSEKGIIYPNFNGMRGHPPLISSDYIKKIIDNNEDGGLKNLLCNYERDAQDVKVVDQGVLLDMDTPEDYKKLLEYYKNSQIPNDEECRAILDKYCVSKGIIGHCEKVRDLSVELAKSLIDRGCKLNVRLIEASALLHDVERDKSRHAYRGWELLNKLGYPNVAEIIKEHMDIRVGENGISEKEIVYLADKMVMDNRVVSIEERFQRSLNKFKKDKQIMEMIKQRKINAEKIKEKIHRFGEDIYENK